MIMALEHQGEDPTTAHVESYLDVVRPHIGSSKLLIVGISLGGLSALRLATLLGEGGNVAKQDTGLIALDSPPLNLSPSLEEVGKDSASGVQIGHAAYIGALAGQSGTNPLARSQWEMVTPNLTMHELDCGHFDIWGRSHAASTAVIINGMIEAMRN